MTSDAAHLGDSMCFAEIQVTKVDTGDSAVENKSPVWPTVSVVLGCIY